MVTAKTGSRRVSEPPAKSATPQTSDEASASVSAPTPISLAGAEAAAATPAPPAALRLVQALDDHRHALAAADAHRLEADRLVERLEIVEERVHDPRAGHPVGVAERDRAAVRVELLAERVDADLPAHGQHLRGERLVQLHDVDVLDRHARVVEHVP